VRWECRSAEYSQNTALYPLTDLFQRILQWQQDETSDEKFTKLEQALSQYRLPVEESVPLFAPLLSLSLPENRYPLLDLSPQRQRQKTLETIVAILLELAERQPVLFILEDLHWTIVVRMIVWTVAVRSWDAAIQYRTGTGTDTTHWRVGTQGITRSTRWAAVWAMRRPAQAGQNPRRLQRNASSSSCWQGSQPSRRKPCARTPHCK